MTKKCVTHKFSEEMEAEIAVEISELRKIFELALTLGFAREKVIAATIKTLRKELTAKRIEWNGYPRSYIPEFEDQNFVVARIRFISELEAENV